ncbi:MAG: Gmad2 immunoglobulin-like domain-containing protein [Bacteroidota bacterium]
MTFLILVIGLVACNNTETKNTSIKIDALKNLQVSSEEIEKPTAIKPASKIYFNKRFKDVTVTKINANRFRIKGQGQFFEANFNWVVEDGHEELKKGFEITDAGAPEWGKFEFTIEIEKIRLNSRLMLILFELSAMDGSRQYELPIVLD